MENKRQNTEMADIFRHFGADYLQKHGMTHQQQDAFTDIMNCRSQGMGGHMLRCDACGHVRHAYNSCRNRHCPKCQYLKQVLWADKLKSRLLPVRYFHIVFTVPSSLHKLFYVNQSLCYEILMRSAGQSILKAGENPRFLGAKTGCVAILHTWGQALTYHPHVHLLVPVGGIDNDMMEWRKTNEKYFAPVKVLSSLFRGIFASAIYRHADKLVLPGTDENTAVESLRKMIYRSKWNVFAKPALNDAGKVIEYLGRYTHRVAISNARIRCISEGKVHFVWKDYSDNRRTKIMKLGGIDFISRFMMHVLPTGFYKIRYYGIFTGKNCSTILDTWLAFNDQQMYLSATEGKAWHEIIEELLDYDPFLCPICRKGRMHRHFADDADPRAA